MGAIGFNELLFILVLLGIIVVIPVVVILQFVKLRSRIRELEYQVRELKSRAGERV